MAIQFIPNDPRAGSAAPALRRKAKRAERPADRAGFGYPKPQPGGVAEPGTPQFLFWQARDAALAALRAWEAFAGPFTQWQGRRKRLPLLPDEGEDLNAFYDRATVSFFHQQVGPGSTVFSGASTDVVAHEVGHGLLDAARPELWDVNFLEAGAFHEAFGDCMAMLTALEDRETREKLLVQAPTLRRRNFVESFGEDLAWGIGKAIPGHNASLPRTAFNRYAFVVPSTLPDDGAPGVLINEVHSFAMVFTGCFWDLIANLYAAAPTPGPAALRRVARQAGKLLLAGARSAVVRPRFYASVGNAMLQADQALQRGRNAEAIRSAFARHALVLEPAAAPRGAPRAGPAPVPRAGPTQPIALDALHPQLAGVVALAPAGVPPGARGAPRGLLPEADEAGAEVRAFVAALLAHRRIELPGGAAVARGARAVAVGRARDHTTHAVRTVGGRQVLQRKRFLCACHAGAFGEALSAR